MIRMEQVNVIKQWYERGAGKLMVESLLPKYSAAIAQYYETPQNLNDKRIAGTYRFEFVQGSTRHTAYVGESGNVYWRLLEHFYNLMNGVTDWGVPAKEFLNGNIMLDWTGSAGTTDKCCREAEEASLINSLKPFLQYTDPAAIEYGNDKRQRGLSREAIRPDICVCSRLRKSRAKELFSFEENVKS